MAAVAPQIRIQPVTTAAERERFLDVPARVYRDDPNWVPPLRSTIAKEIAPERPSDDDSERQFFVALVAAEPNAEAIGRVGVAIDRRLIEREERSVGLVGYFECVPEFAVADALLSAACDWLRERGMELARGPIDLSTHIRCLQLVDGFEQPFVMMPYNPPYYAEFWERAGWMQAIDAYSYRFGSDSMSREMFARAYRVAITSGVTFRPLRLRGKEFEEDVNALYDLFTRAFANNWSSAPRTREDFMEEARSLQSLVDPDIFPIAECDGQMVGFFMALPDYNQALKHVDGRLNLWGLLKFLWFRRQIDRVRVLVLCSLPEYRRKMVPLALIYLAFIGGTRENKGYQTAELGFVFANNSPSRRLIEAAGGTISKTYRAYEKPL
ncbi:hypothetical protein KR51_00023740 [Rubidibacter lacunae KORDI 51-2]|uniref:N-acetyltransferase domain-containing protein n=1 Tax=Rubidibacter lacunae KORDI 51-2 TaxID=582515 RepID=U5DJP2_9CHRO|nr:hypothetical protein [Rubidibacter lacunae]ERN41112.1 hypothetical protein KR51_00023740 [Rubidibacter lacunae KORDI 51-2]